MRGNFAAKQVPLVDKKAALVDLTCEQLLALTTKISRNKNGNMIEGHLLVVCPLFIVSAHAVSTIKDGSGDIFGLTHLNCSTRRTQMYIASSLESDNHRTLKWHP